jgi:hypothetical protein
LKLNQKTARLKNPFTIPDPYTYQGLSNNTTFRPILSGATVPLTLDPATPALDGEGSVLSRGGRKIVEFI